MSTPADVSEPRDVSWIWYVVALVLYIGLGLLLKSVLLNWIIGPLFLLMVLYLVPTAVRRLWQAMRR